MVELSVGLDSDFVLSFFFFFLDISAAIAYFGKLLLVVESADHSPGVSSACCAAVSSVSLLFFFFLFSSLTSTPRPSSCVVTSSISTPLASRSFEEPSDEGNFHVERRPTCAEYSTHILTLFLLRSLLLFELYDGPIFALHPLRVWGNRDIGSSSARRV